MAFGVLGFPLVVLAAIGNVPLAAVSVIYADVHFCAAILTEKQARQRVDFPVPVGASDGRIFQNPLCGFKVGAVNNRLMHIFGYLPLAPVYIVVPLVAEVLCGLEVDNITAILLPCEDMGQGGFVPLGRCKCSCVDNGFCSGIWNCNTKEKPERYFIGNELGGRRKC